jgi:hypothetical protein
MDSNVRLLMNITKNDLRVLESERLFQDIIAFIWIRRQQLIFVFVKLWKAAVSFVMSVRPITLLPFRKNQLPLDGYLWNLYWGRFINLSSGLKFVWNCENTCGTLRGYVSKFMFFLWNCLRLWKASWSADSASPTRPVLWLQVDQPASKCAGQLRIYWISSCGKPTRGCPPARG